MKYTSSPSIIMRIRDLGESDLLVTFFTPDRGQLKGVAKAARKSRKRFANCLETFSLADLEYGIRKDGGLCFIRSGRLLDGFPGLRGDFNTLSKASFMIELTEVLFPSEVADRAMFDHLSHSLGRLASGSESDQALLFFEARALALGGYAIRTEKCCICGRHYTHTGTAVFKREKGGIACLRCQQKSTETPSLTPESVSILEHMQHGAIAEPGCVWEGATEEIRSVIDLHREYRLERRLKTLKYLL
ncbi:MAG: DNA repair protein RecO [Deltaproteobacteria bacterium HGW-Deltaproteobacteria-15]|jgi:DNA repair protein RecO (recombination protein O)|nr:MAG: DNA repair protein RecO [Deltaproteobacteria bacterium HGW-Deltaproteobacteria-15]